MKLLAFTVNAYFKMMSIHSSEDGLLEREVPLCASIVSFSCSERVCHGSHLALALLLIAIAAEYLLTVKASEREILARIP